MTTRDKAFDAIDKVSEMGDWYAKFMADTRAYIFELEAYIKEIEQDYDELESKGR